MNESNQLPYFAPLWARLLIIPVGAALVVAALFMAWSGASGIAKGSWIGIINLFWAAFTGMVVRRCADLAFYRNSRGSFAGGKLMLWNTDRLEPVTVPSSDLIVVDHPWLKFASVKSSRSGKTLFSTDYIYPHGVSTIIAILQNQGALGDERRQEPLP